MNYTTKRGLKRLIGFTLSMIMILGAVPTQVLAEVAEQVSEPAAVSQEADTGSSTPDTDPTPTDTTEGDNVDTDSTEDSTEDEPEGASDEDEADEAATDPEADTDEGEANDDDYNHNHGGNDTNDNNTADEDDEYEDDYYDEYEEDEYDEDDYEYGEEDELAEDDEYVVEETEVLHLVTFDLNGGLIPVSEVDSDVEILDEDAYNDLLIEWDIQNTHEPGSYERFEMSQYDYNPVLPENVGEPVRRGRAFARRFGSRGNRDDAVASVSVIIAYGETVGIDMPADPLYFNEESEMEYAFVGWNTEADGSGDTFDEHSVVTEGTIVFAQFAGIVPAGLDGTIDLSLSNTDLVNASVPGVWQFSPTILGVLSAHVIRIYGDNADITLTGTALEHRRVQVAGENVTLRLNNVHINNIGWPSATGLGVVRGAITIAAGVSNTHIIVNGGTTNSLTGAHGSNATAGAGITVGHTAGGSALTISGSGTLHATGGNGGVHSTHFQVAGGAPGIGGGGNAGGGTMFGGTITITDNVTIIATGGNGGVSTDPTLSGVGGGGAGIGGGGGTISSALQSPDGGGVNSITITGNATVTATGGAGAVVGTVVGGSGAGIGGGGGGVNTNNGLIGCSANVQGITISGNATVTATGVNRPGAGVASPGIGLGSSGFDSGNTTTAIGGSRITITGGVVRAIGGTGVNAAQNAPGITRRTLDNDNNTVFAGGSIHTTRGPAGNPAQGVGIVGALPASFLPPTSGPTRGNINLALVHITGLTQFNTPLADLNAANQAIFDAALPHGLPNWFNQADTRTTATGELYLWVPPIHSLTVGNFPTSVTPTGQAPTATNRPTFQTEDLTWNPGTVTNFDFLGWVSSASAPGLTVGGPTSAVTFLPAGTGATQATPEMMPGNDVTRIAVWGDANAGTVGVPATRPLTVANHPTTVVLNATPAQTTGGNFEVNQPLNLVSGEATSWQFIGWAQNASATDLADANGMTWAAATAVAGPLTAIAANANMPHSIPAATLAVTAVWGFDGIIGTSGQALTVNNFPTVTLNATPVQTVSGTRGANTALNLVSGEATGWTFMGWAQNASTTDLNNAVGMTWAAATAVAGPLTAILPTANMPASALTVTAVWGANGVIGGYQLTVENFPTTVTLNATPVQTPSAIRGPGVALNLEHGSVTNWDFIGWALNASATDLADAAGMTWAAATAVAGPLTAIAATANMPAQATTVTAVWGRNGVIGDSRLLTVANFPTTITLDATPVQTPNGARIVGTALNLEQGAATGWNFMGWALNASATDLTDAVGMTWAAATAGAGPLTAIAASANMPTTDTTVTAVWGRNGIIGDSRLLTVENFPSTITLDATPVQTPNGARIVGTALNLEQGAATGWDFMGWALNASATDLADAAGMTWAAATAGAGPLTAIAATGNMPTTDTTVTAVWGRNGIIGDSRMLTVANFPSTITLDATPVQTANGARVVGVALNLEHGAATGWDFMGWALNASATDLADATGMTWAAATAVAGPLTAILATANMPTTDTTVTAVWGRNGIIGDARLLTVANFPSTITLDATPVQTPNGARIVGTALNLEHGAATGWDFMGWALNASATDLADAAGMTWAAATAGAGPLTAIAATANMPTTDTTVTAVWGRNGIIGDSRLLTVANFPSTITLDATPVQTPNGARIVGTALNLEHGAATGWDFMGWALNASATDLADAAGMTWAAATAGAGPLTAIAATANMPTTDTTVTAVWGRNGIIGDARLLTVANFPSTITLDATPVQTPNGARIVGTALNLEHGAATGWDFMGWALNASTTDLADATGMTWAAATAVAGPLTAILATANMPTTDTTVTAVWGRNGIIGDARLLTVANFPSTITLDATPVQTPNGARIVGTALNLEHGAATGWDFMGWALNASATDLADAAGMTWAAATAVAGPLTAILATANMPSTDTTVTAVWGAGGVVGGYMLTVNNFPTVTLLATPVQTASGIRGPGTALNLESGEVTVRDFLGWALNASATDLTNASGMTWTAATAVAGPLTAVAGTANMPFADTTVTAVWGSNGVIEGQALTVDNFPAVTLNATPVQTPSGTRGANTPLNLEHGAATGWDFMGWAQNATPTDLADAVGMTWAAATAVAGPLTAILPTANMPTGSLAVTAVWGANGVVGGYTLTVENSPSTITLNATPVQTPSGIRGPGVALNLESGAATGWDFMGWALNASATDLADAAGMTWAAATAVAGPLTAIAATANMPFANTTVTAVWGRNGIIGDSRLLTVANFPSTITLDATPVQTPNGARIVGTALNLAHGAATGWDFMGWALNASATDLADAAGMTWAAATAVAGPLTAILATANMPATDTTVTAVWGRNGIIGDSRMLTVANFPSTITLDATPVQTPNGARIVGTALNLEHGAATGWDFMGWALNASATDLADAAGMTWAAATAGAGPLTAILATANMPATDTTVTAVWGRNGIIGDSRLLTVANFPTTITLDATPVQTPNGARVVGTALNLESGAATGWDFMGWALNASATDLADATGMTWAAATAGAGPLTAILATANMPATDTTVTAVWGRNGVIGDARMLTVANFPSTITLDATPVQTASGARVVGTALNLESGAATNWDFMGWALNASATDLADAAGMTWAAATAVAGPLTAILATANMPTTDTTVTAVWGRNGVIGDSRMLTVQNFPSTITLNATPVQTATGTRVVGVALNLEHGAATGWDFMGWALNASATDLADAAGMTWPAATAVAGPLTAILATANMPTTDTTVTAVWGRNGVIGDARMLTVENFPTTITLNATPVQTASGARIVGTALNLAHGAATGWDFMGWALNPSATDLADAAGMTWAAATAGAGPLTAILATDNMPATDTTVTAVWGRNGVIGDSRLLTVQNFPTTITLDATPVQTTGGARIVGTALNLASGAATGWDFMGWALNPSAADLATASGMTWAAATAGAGPLTEILATANMPAADTTVTAVWGRNGVIGDVRMLTVENFPTTITLNATPVQSATGTRPVGVALNLISGAAIDWTFMGWALNASAADLAAATGMTWAAATAGAGPLTAIAATANMPNADTTVTAVWGRNGIIGDARLLTVGNFPTNITLNATPAQTASGARIVGTALNLVSGAATNWEFLGWAQGASAADLAASTGMTWAAATAGAGPLTEILATANMPDANTTVTAVWGVGGIIGGGNHTLTILNYPPTVNPTGQTPSGTRQVGQALNLQPGTVVNWNFLGWTTDASEAVTGQTAPGTFPSAPPANMPNISLTVIGVWGNDAGVIGIPNTPPVTPTPQSPRRPSAGIWAPPRPLNVVEVDPITELEPIQEDRIMRMIPAYVSGFPDGSFMPNGSATRAEVAAMLYRLLDQTNARRPMTSNSTFSDVSSDAWYYHFVTTLAAMDVITGYPDGTFRPNQPITRAELTSLVTRFVQASNMTANNRFTDLNSSHWAFGFIMQAYGHGWIVGYPDGTFRPDANITRAEAVTVINNATNRHQHAHLLRFTEYFTDVNGHWAYNNIMLAAEDLIWFE